MHATELQTEVFRTLADPTRRSLFERLAKEGELTVSALTAKAKVSQPAVSQHLAALKLAGLVRDRKEGRTTHYSCAPQGLKPLINWVEYYRRRSGPPGDERRLAAQLGNSGARGGKL